MSGKLIYWDTCLFLAYFKNENRPAGEMEGLHDLAKEVDAGKKILVTSVVTRMEILRSTLTKEQNGKYDLLFKRRNFQEMPIDKRVVALAHDLRDYYQQQKAKDGLPTLGTPDSIHLATAIVWKAECFYTFDAKDKGMKVRAILPQGADNVVDTSGNVGAISTALSMLSPHGTLGLVGVPGSLDAVLPLPIVPAITYGYTVKGIIEGDSDPDTFLPELIALHGAGKLPVERFSTVYRFDQINQALADSYSGKCIKAILEFPA